MRRLYLSFILFITFLTKIAYGQQPVAVRPGAPSFMRAARLVPGGLKPVPPGDDQANSDGELATAS
jgi:hypothetical protein